VCLKKPLANRKNCRRASVGIKNVQLELKTWRKTSTSLPEKHFKVFPAPTSKRLQTRSCPAIPNHGQYITNFCIYKHDMWSQLLDWAFHWTLLWIAFEVGRRWNEKDVAASIAALTEKQSRRRSQEFTETPEKVRAGSKGPNMLTIGSKKSSGKSHH